MKRIAFLFALATIVAACDQNPNGVVGIDSIGVPALSAAASTDNETFSIVEEVFVPCSAGGAGEAVLLEGNFHVLFHVTLDAAGGFHLKTHFQPQGISGVGLTTGDRYQATGVTQDQANGRIGSETTLINNFRIIGQGRGNNFLIHETFHVTVNANGAVTAFVDNFRVECK